MSWRDGLSRQSVAGTRTDQHGVEEEERKANVDDDNIKFDFESLTLMMAVVGSDLRDHSGLDALGSRLESAFVDLTTLRDDLKKVRTDPSLR
jgi:hypothetical protein